MVCKAVNEELWDEFLGPWGWLDMHVTTIKLARDMPADRYPGDLRNGFRHLLRFAVRESVGTVIMHEELFSQMLEKGQNSQTFTWPALMCLYCFPPSANLQGES